MWLNFTNILCPKCKSYQPIHNNGLCKPCYNTRYAKFKELQNKT